MDTAATQPGVVSRRTEMMAEIVKQREGEIDRELKEGGTEGGIAVFAREAKEGDPLRPESVPEDDWAAMSDEQKGQAITEEKARAEAAKGEAGEPKDAAQKAAEEPPKKYKGKVDGQEVEFDEESVIKAGLASLQKESAADKRLEEASREKAEAERLRKAAEASAAHADPAGGKGKSGLVIEKDGLREIVKAIQYGTPDEAESALAQYGERMAQLGQANATTLAEVQNFLDLREAQQFVRKEYADLVEDPNTKILFVHNINQKLAAGDARPYHEIAVEVGDSLRTWKGAPAKADPTPKEKGGSRAEIKERKTTIVHVPSAAARQPAPTVEKAPTPAETIARMRQARDRQAGRQP